MSTSYSSSLGGLVVHLVYPPQMSYHSPPCLSKRVINQTVIALGTQYSGLPPRLLSNGYGDFSTAVKNRAKYKSYACILQQYTYSLKIICYGKVRPRDNEKSVINRKVALEQQLQMNTFSWMLGRFSEFAAAIILEAVEMGGKPVPNPSVSAI